MNLIDYMQMGIYGAVTLEYFPETERLQVSWFPAGRPRANFVCGVKVINETVLEFDKIKDEQGEVFNILPMALLGRRLRVADQFELLGISVEPKMRFLLLKTSGGVRWVEVVFS